jgi:hypothetical protein
MDLISYFEEGETITLMMNRAGRYWAAVEQRGVTEVLLEGSARILRRIETTPAPYAQQLNPVRG